MRDLSSEVVAALSSGHVVLVNFVRIDFPSGTIGLNSSNWTFTHEGVEYRGAFGLGSFSAITDSPGELPGVQLELLLADATMIALALDSVDEVQGSLITISTAILDNSTYQILDVITDWIGYADTMSISEDGEKASVVLTAESKAVDLLRGNPLLYNDADQQFLYPGDRAFEYISSQADKPVVWPRREWFYK